METLMRKNMMKKSRPIPFGEFGWILPNYAMLQLMLLLRVAKKVNFETRILIKVLLQARKAIDDGRKMTSLQSLFYGGLDGVLV